MAFTVWIDANVILRIVTGNPVPMAAEVQQFAELVDEGLVIAKVSPMVVAECVWTLDSYYGFKPSEIAPTMSSFIQTKGIETEERSVLLKTLEIYEEEESVDFIDVYVAVKASVSPDPRVVTWDKHFRKLGISHAKPNKVMDLQPQEEGTEA